jgi:adenylate cyclase
MFKRAVQMDPDYGRAWAYLACTHACHYLYFEAAEESRAQARRASERAMELAPGLAESHVAAALSLSLLGDYPAADREFEKAISIGPDSFDAWYFYARSQVQQGHRERAARLFDKAAQVHEDDYQCLFLKASQLERLGRVKQASEALTAGLQRARAHLELHPDDWRAWNLGAIAYLRLGRESKAGLWLRTSLHNAPRDSAVAYNAACFHALKGDSKTALQHLKDSVGVGSINREWVLQDPDLLSIRETPEFARLVKQFPSRLERSVEPDGSEAGKPPVEDGRGTPQPEH